MTKKTLKELLQEARGKIYALRLMQEDRLEAYKEFSEVDNDGVQSFVHEKYLLESYKRLEQVLRLMEAY